MRIKIDRCAVLRKYQPTKLRMKLGLAYLFDGLVILLTLGTYRGYASVDVSMEILQYTAAKRKRERQGLVND